MSQPPVSRCCRQARPQRIRTQAALQHLPVPPDPRSRHAGDPWAGSAVALLSITPVTGTEQGHVAMWPVLAANSSLLLTSIFIWGGGRHALLAANTHHRARARSSSPRAVSGACHPRRRCAAATTVVAGRRLPAARVLCRPLPPRTARAPPATASCTAQSPSHRRIGIELELPRARTPHSTTATATAVGAPPPPPPRRCPRPSRRPAASGWRCPRTPGATHGLAGGHPPPVRPTATSPAVKTATSKPLAFAGKLRPRRLNT
jgi:hypothetical protein